MSELQDLVARQRISKDLATNFLVEASAGSGKTYSLVSRLVTGIVTQAFSVESLAVVTFTRKAAAELGGRLRLALEADPSLAAREALKNFEQIFVGTVHSFCAQILRRFPVQAGISPGFREMEEAEDLLLQRKVLREALSTREGRRLLRLLAEFGAGVKDLIAGLKCIVAYGEMQYASEDCPRPNLEQAWQAVDEFQQFLATNLPVTDERDPTCKLLIAGASLQRRAASAQRGTPGDLVRLLEEWEGDLKPVKRYWGATRAEQTQNLDAFLIRSQAFQEGFARRHLVAWRAHLYSQCLPFLCKVRAACQSKRQELALVNFHDLLSKCTRLVREHPQVRKQLQGRFCHLLVDEFQDTDPLQAELFFLLSSQEADQPDWARVTPRPGSLFLVGDPKQSIYRFRRADIETYHAVRDRIIQTGGDVLSLVTSFRSTPSLCQWINQVFASVLPAQPTPEQAAFAPLVAGPQADGSQAAVVTLTMDSPRYQDVALDEAGRIADYIGSAVKSGRYRYGDFLVLTVRKAELPLYHSTLRDNNIPCLVSADPSPLSEMGMAFTTLLQVLANPHDSMSLVGLLRGPLCGHSDEELYLHCRDVGGLRVGTAEGSRVNSTLLKLENWRKQTRLLPLGAATQLVLAESGLEGDEELESLAEILGQRGEAGLTLSQALVEILENKSVPVISGFVGQRDVVRVMNLHKAKGLEARMVFLAAPTNGLPSNANHAMKRSPEGLSGALCMWRGYKRLAHPLNWDELEAQELTFLAAERHRLLYVAATRAKETLVVGRWSGSHGSALRAWAELEPFLAGCPELGVPVSPLRGTEGGGLESVDAQGEATEFLSFDDFHILQATEKEAREACSRPSWRRAAVSATPGDSSFTSYLPPDGLQGQGTAWGDVIHKLLEQMVSRPQLSRDELASLARWFTFDSPELTDLIPAALDVLEKIKQTDFWNRVAQARDRLVEVPFGQKAGSTLLMGVIDLVLRQEEGWDIIDYKTDRQKLEALIAKYAGQVLQYAGSWEAITEESVNFCGHLRSEGRPIVGRPLRPVRQ